jgi:nucleotide-binding universal stress UspA family protein
MSIRDVLLLGASRGSAAGAYALSVASSFNAHLTATGLVLDLSALNAREILSYDVFVSATENKKAALLDDLERFAREARINDVNAEVDVITAGLGTAREALAQFARRFDLTIVEQSNAVTRKEQDLELEAVLFGSGRPVIVVPYIHKDPLRLDTVLVAWDGSSVAARAIGDAMPLSVRARQVQIVTVAAKANEQIEISGAHMARHLARHRINAELKILYSELDAANTLLSHAVDRSADLLVMGAYGHSRYREFLLGGTTRTILQSMTLPVFMSH